MAPCIFIFSIVLSAEYLPFVKSIATFALTVFGYIILLLASVSIYFSIGNSGAQVHKQKQCHRCVIVNVDPDTGIMHPKGEPLKTLHKFRPFDFGSGKEITSDS